MYVFFLSVFSFHICYHFPFSCFLKDHIMTQSYNLLASAPGPVGAFDKIARWQFF